MRRFVTTKSKYSLDPNLVLNLPLYETGLKANIFASYDIYAHKCSVTGATWGLQGRTFDGLLNKIDCGAASSLDITGDITLEAWFKATQVDAYQELINKYDGQNGYRLMVYGDNSIFFQMSKAGANYPTTSTPGGILINTWYHVMCTRSGTTAKIYLNGVDDTAAGGNIPDCGSYAGSVKLGIYSDSASYPFKGITGEARIYNRASSLAEAQHNRLATKWRYL